MSSNWKTKLNFALEENGESFIDVISNTMSEEEMLVKFDYGYGETGGIPFTVWTHKHVYFPICYDGSEWVGCASRFPDGKPTDHQGG